MKTKNKKRPNCCIDDRQRASKKLAKGFLKFVLTPFLLIATGVYHEAITRGLTTIFPPLASILPGAPRIEVVGFLPVFTSAPDTGKYETRNRGPEDCKYPLFSFHGVIAISNKSDVRSYFNQVTIAGDVSDVFNIEREGERGIRISPKYSPRPLTLTQIRSGDFRLKAFLYLNSKSLRDDERLIDSYDTRYLKLDFSEPASLCDLDIRMGAAYTALADDTNTTSLYYIDKPPVFVLGTVSLNQVVALVPSFEGPVTVDASIGTFHFPIKMDKTLVPVTLTEDAWKMEDGRKLFEQRAHKF